MIPQSKTFRVTGITALLLLPLLLQAGGMHWVRSADTCLLYLMLALGMNIVVGYAGLLDLGFVAFYAVGAYMYALLASPHLCWPPFSACCLARPRSGYEATTWPS